LPPQDSIGLMPDTAADAVLLRLFDTSPDPVGLVDVNGVWLHANPAGLRMAYLTEVSALAGRPLEAYFDPTAAIAMRAAIRRAAAGHPMRLPVRSVTMDRTKRWWDVSVWRIDPPDGPGRIAMWCREITAAKLADAELRGQTRVLRSILHDAPMGEILTDVCKLAESLLPGSLCAAHILDPKTKTLRHGASPSLPPEYLALTDGTPIGPGHGSCAAAAFLGAPVMAADIATHPDWQDCKALAAAHGLSACWSVPLRAGGETVGTFAVYFRAPRAPMEDETARIDTCANLAALALEQVAARRARAESEARFHTAAGLIPGYLFVAKPSGGRLYANTYLEDRCGVTRQHMRGSGLKDVVHPDDIQPGLSAWNNAIVTGEGYEHRFRLRMLDGHYRWHLGRVLPQLDANGTVTAWVGVAVDIDELIAGREMLQRYRAELEELVAQRTAALTATAAELQAEMARREQAMSALAHSQKIEALGQLTGGVAHDFNNILAAITGCLELIDRRTQDGGLKRLAQSGLQAAGRAASLVRQLLAIARREAPSPTILQPATALPGMHDLIRHAVTNRIELRIEVPPETWPIYVDAPQLETSLLNLAVNGRDAMKQGGVLTIAATNMPAEAPRPPHVRRRDTVRIDVRDTGIGMDKALANQIFEPFFTTKPRGEGTGLGLAMVRSFVQQAGGDIAIESESGAGTCISLYLPRAEPGASTQKPPPRPRTAAAVNATLLVVDDDDAVREITTNFLRDAGYRVLEANGGPVALALLQTAEKVDLVVTDLAMPGMDGVELAHALRATRPNLPVVFVTGYADQHDLAGEIVVQKPFTAVTLNSAMLEALGRRPDGANLAERMLARMRAGIIRDAFQHWQSLRGAGALPGFGQMTLAGRIWADNAFVVSVDTSHATPRFGWVSVGPALAKRLPPSTAGDPTPGPQTEAILGDADPTYRSCVETGSPVYQTGLLPAAGGTQVSYERLLLPVSAEHGGISHLLGIVAFGG